MIWPIPDSSRFGDRSDKFSGHISTKHLHTHRFRFLDEICILDMLFYQLYHTATNTRTAAWPHL